MTNLDSIIGSRMSRMKVLSQMADLSGTIADGLQRARDPQLTFAENAAITQDAQARFLGLIAETLIVLTAEIAAANDETAHARNNNR